LGTNRAKVEVKAVFRGSMALYNSEVKKRVCFNDKFELILEVEIL